MTTVYIFQNSYYIGEDENVIKNALRSEEVEIADGYTPKVVDGVLTLVEESDVYE